MFREAPSPIYFTSIPCDGVALERVLEEYLDWIEGIGSYAELREARVVHGVPADLNRAALRAGASSPLANGCQLALRIGTGRAVLRFVHRDETQPEAWWRSVVRLTEASSEGGVFVEHAVACTTPRTAWASTAANAPSVVERLCALGGTHPDTRALRAGGPLHLSEEDAEGFVRHVLVDPARNAPYVLVSPEKASGDYLIDPDLLSKGLATQAVVVALALRATWELANAFVDLGFERAAGVCFDGAIRVYQAGLAPDDNARDHYLWLSARLRGYGPTPEARSMRIAPDVVDRITWRALPVRFFSLVEDWDRDLRHTRTEEVLQRASAVAADPVTPLETRAASMTALEAQLRDVEAEREIWEKQARDYEADVNALHRRVERAEQERDEAQQESQRAAARLARTTTHGNGLSDDHVSALRAALRGRPMTLEGGLRALEALYPERLVVLPSAWSSARAATAFRRADKAFALMLVLAEDYWSAIQLGGDASARKCFSDAAFASRESESVEQRRAARELRTFDYHGAPLVMWKHLKIGVKDSVVETWRLHFEFDAVTKRIVIGHCGKHLDFK